MRDKKKRSIIIGTAVLVLLIVGVIILFTSNHSLQLSEAALTDQVNALNNQKKYSAAEKLIDAQSYAQTSKTAARLRISIALNKGDNTAALNAYKAYAARFGMTDKTAETLGDLSVAIGNKTQAVTYYKQAASLYLNDKSDATNQSDATNAQSEATRVQAAK